MSRLMRAVVAVLVAMLAAPAIGGRLTDREVKELLDRIYQDRDRFEDQLDDRIKRSTLRSATTEVNVERFLDDLQENVHLVQERFKPEYAASAEVTTLLRQGTAIQRYMSTQPPNFKGASEWNRLAEGLSQLAGAYGVALPLAEGQTARRINDRELKAAADGIEENADRFKKEVDSSLKKVKSIDSATRESAVRDAEALKNEAKTLADRVGDGHPASGEAEQLLQHAAKLRTASAAWPLSAAAKSAWSSIDGGLAKVAQAFGR